MSRDADQFAEGAIMNSPHKFDKRGRTSDLKSYIDAYFAVRAGADFECASGLCNVNANRLFAISMFSRGHDGSEVLDVKKGRRRNLDGVDLVGGCKFLICVRAAECQFAIRPAIAE